MEIVLGVSMTPTTVSIALVEGEKADGVIVEHDVFDITAIDGSATSSASDHVIAAVLGTQEGAIAAGHHLVSTGVTWTDHAQAAVLREALVARGIEDVLLVSELHAAAALAQAVGRAVGYDKTALMFVERDTATLAVVETADGSVVKVLEPKSARCGRDRRADRNGHQPAGRGIDAPGPCSSLAPAWTSPRSRHICRTLSRCRSSPLKNPSWRWRAALRWRRRMRRATTRPPSAWPTHKIPTRPRSYPMALADDATTFLGHDDASPDTADIASDPDDVPERSKPFLLMGSSLTAIFVAGVMALTIAMVVNVQPTADQGSDDMTVHPDAVAPPTAVQSAPPAAPQQVPKTVPAPAPAAPPPAAIATARLKVPPAPPPPSSGAQRCARPGGATTRAGRSAARCASAGDTAADHPVAATDSSATPLLQPGSEGARGPRRRRPRWRRAWARRR